LGGATGRSSSCLAVQDLWRVNAATIGLGSTSESLNVGNHGGRDYRRRHHASSRNAATNRIGLLSYGGNITQGAIINVRDLGLITSGNIDGHIR
jgi:hypothetical protein